jgi:hypothetical protein
MSAARKLAALAGVVVPPKDLKSRSMTGGGGQEPIACVGCATMPSKSDHLGRETIPQQLGPRAVHHLRFRASDQPPSLSSSSDSGVGRRNRRRAALQQLVAIADQPLSAGQAEIVNGRGAGFITNTSRAHNYKQFH